MTDLSSRDQSEAGPVVASGVMGIADPRFKRVGFSVGKRLLHVVLVLLFVSFLTAVLVDFVPGEPAYVVIGQNATDEQVEEFNQQLGLDRPVFERYTEWVAGVAQGDLGTSFRTRQSVRETVMARLPVTVELAALSMLIALMVAVPLGVYTSYRQRGVVDHVSGTATSVVIATPVFAIGLLLSYFLSVKLQWFPVTGYHSISDGLAQNLEHMILPALTLALPEMAIFTRLLRADMVSTLQEDHILAARAAGLPNRTMLWKYALKPSSFTLLTLAGLSVGRMLGGAVIVEQIFGLPGVGQLLFQAITSKDYPVVQAVVLIVAVTYVLANAAIDGLYQVLDPRLRVRRA